MAPLMPRARTLALVAAPLALAVGCGEEERTVRSSDARAMVTLDDYLLDPQRLSVPAGTVRLTVANRGRIGHTLRLRKQGRLYVEVPTQLPGERTTIERELPRGTYEMFCEIANHEELGMFGTLVAR
jgi:plastocyanin